MRFQYTKYGDDTPDGMVEFWCPTCGDKGHVQVRPDPQPHYWQLLQAEPLSISPSVRWFGHCHFNITNGEVLLHADEPCKGSTEFKE